MIEFKRKETQRRQDKKSLCAKCGKVKVKGRVNCETCLLIIRTNARKRKYGEPQVSKQFSTTCVSCGNLNNPLECAKCKSGSLYFKATNRRIDIEREIVK